MIKVALLLCSAAVCTAEYRKNSKPELQNQFLFCNMFLLFVRYLHGGHKGVFWQDAICVHQRDLWETPAHPVINMDFFSYYFSSY